MPQRSLFLLIGAVILAAGVTIAAMLWLGGGTLTPWAVVGVLAITGLLKFLLYRRQ